MKNLFTSVAFLLAAFSMQAKEYSGNLNIEDKQAVKSLSKLLRNNR